MKDDFSELRRQILEDVLGDSVEEYENFNRDEVGESKRQHRQRIPLWQFILHLLNRDKTSRYIEWNADHVLEFRIKDTMAIAELWGSVKNKTDMTYEKLGRAMRYYYGKSIIEKVSGRRYSYRFILSRRTRKYISQFQDMSMMKVQKIVNVIDKSDVESLDEEVFNTSPAEEKMTFTPLASPKQTVMFSAKITPVKPTPTQQTLGKTKIFKPEDLTPNSFRFLSYTSPSVNDKCRYLDENRKSAFMVPNKVAKHNDTGPFKITDVSTFSFQNIKDTPSQSVNLKHKDTLFCSCGSLTCKSSNGCLSDDYISECESSCGSMSPQNIVLKHNYPQLTSYSNISNNNLDEYTLNEETHQEMVNKQDVTQLQRTFKLNRRFDPFMGSDHNDMLYDPFEDYIHDDGYIHPWKA